MPDQTGENARDLGQSVEAPQSSGQQAGGGQTDKDSNQQANAQQGGSDQQGQGASPRETRSFSDKDQPAEGGRDVGTGEGGQGGPRGDDAGGQETSGLNAGATDSSGQQAGKSESDVERGSGPAAG